jgi:hypothetical protein
MMVDLVVREFRVLVDAAFLIASLRYLHLGDMPNGQH